MNFMFLSKPKSFKGLVMFVVLSSCMLMCVCVRARAGRAMLVGHSVNDLCKFLLPIPKKKKQKGGCFKRVATF